MIVREALIDLGRRLWRPRSDILSNDSSVFFLKLHGHSEDGWDSGYWELFSYDKLDGWVVEAVDYLPDDQSMPGHVRLFFEEIHLIMRITHLDSNEERRWRVTLGFPLPTPDPECKGGWLLPSKEEWQERVLVEEL